MDDPKSGGFLGGLFTALCWLSVIWVIRLIEYYQQISFVEYALGPKDISRLYGIFTMPFIHLGEGKNFWTHILSNSGALLVNTILVYWFYRRVYWKATLMIIMIGGLWTWLLGQQGSLHAGASGLIYGYVSFLFFGGVFSKNYRLMALSMLVVFLYGSMIWYIFPIVPGISWEGHLAGGAAGLLAAYYFRRKLPQRPQYSWELEEEEEEEDLGLS